MDDALTLSSIPLPRDIKPGNVDGFQKKEFLYQFAVDTWLKQLESHTFPTKIINISSEEGKAILAAHRKWMNPTENKIEAVHEQLLHELEKKIDTTIKELGGAAFVKLSHRSPKDVCMRSDNKKVQGIFTSLLESIEESDFHAQVKAWNLSLVKFLRVTSGKEAMTLLIESFRISSDLSADVEYPEFFKSKLIVRQYMEQLDPAFEFRAFVSNNKLTALSQYETVFYPEVKEQKTMIEQRILNFFYENVKGKIPHKSYVIDFCIIEGRIYIVELNPFHANTSGCLFSWKDDRELILNGPFSFRIVEKDPANILDQIPELFREIARNHYHKRSQLTSIKSGLAFAAGVSIVAAWFYLRWVKKNE